MGNADRPLVPDSDSGEIGRRIGHLKGIHGDLRDEIKRRIEQRDRYAHGLTLSVGALLSLAVTQDPAILIIVPFVALFYGYLFDYSYRIHKTLAAHISGRLEPELQALHRCELPEPATWTDAPAEWELAYLQSYRQIPGIRARFLKIILVALSGMSIACVWSIESAREKIGPGLLAVATLSYWLAFSYFIQADRQAWLRARSIRDRKRRLRASLEVLVLYRPWDLEP